MQFPSTDWFNNQVFQDDTCDLTVFLSHEVKEVRASTISHVIGERFHTNVTNY